MTQKSICLVSPGHISSNPRLVKEANALYAAGFQVRVVAGDCMIAIRTLDKTILSKAPWSWVQVGLGIKPSYLGRRLGQKLAQTVASSGWIPHLSLAIWAHSPMSYRLAKAAAAQHADLYIAHCLAALPAVFIAAQKHNAKLGFDAEDFHIGELADTPANQTEIAVRDHIERTLLPHCHHLTAASPMIAQAYGERYGVKMEKILNVFPLSEAPELTNIQAKYPLESEPSLYWFSQTIGPGRGLEAIIMAMGQMQTRVSLHLRGTSAVGYRETLMKLATEMRVSDHIYFLPPAPPSEMAQLASEYDVGLSLELSEPFNRAICLTNKIFTYLLAGLPVLMSNTPAQKQLALELGDTAVIVDIENPKAIALALDKWFFHPLDFELACVTARKLGREIYNWDVEQHKFLGVVERALI